MTIPNLEKEIIYNDADHTYIRVRDEKLLAGVSSVSALATSRESGGFLKQWAVNEAIEFIKNNSEKIDDDEEAIYYNVSEYTLNESKYAHKEKGKEATDIGTQIHAILEDYVKAKMFGSDIVIPENEITRLFRDEFLKWEKENNVDWVASELLVGDPEKLELAGRLDALAFVNGILTIIDFKVANTVPPTYYIQLAGYAICLEAMGIEAKDSLIIRLPKSEKKKFWDEESHKYKMVDNIIEFINPPTDINWDKEVFVKLREVYKWINHYYK